MKLRRTRQDDEGTFGHLTLDGFEAVTVERPKDGDHPCIPAGTYNWKKFVSPHNGPCLLLEGVPGRTMIEMHAANFMLQLLGCIAPGRDFARFTGTWEGQPYDLQGVSSSKLTLGAILSLLPDTGTIEITEEF